MVCAREEGHSVVPSGLTSDVETEGRSVATKVALHGSKKVPTRTK